MKKGEGLFMKGMKSGKCEVHDWPIEKWKTDFVKLLRERHGKGGLNVCAHCIEVARSHYTSWDRIDSMKRGSVFVAKGDGETYRYERVMDGATGGAHRVVNVNSGHVTCFAGCAHGRLLTPSE